MTETKPRLHIAALFGRSFARELGKTLGYWLVMLPLLGIALTVVDEAPVVQALALFIRSLLH